MYTILSQHLFDNLKCHIQEVCDFWLINIPTIAARKGTSFTMAPGNGNNNNNYNRNRSKETHQRVLTPAKKEWASDSKKKVINLSATTNGGVKLYQEFNIYTGTEPPELFLIWWINFNTIVLNNSQLLWDSRMDLLLSITDGMTKTTVESVYNNVRYPTYGGIADKNNFNWKSPLVTTWHERHLDAANAQTKKDNWNKYYFNHNTQQNVHRKHIMDEAKWNLGLHA